MSRGRAARSWCRSPPTARSRSARRPRQPGMQPSSRSAGSPGGGASGGRRTGFPSSVAHPGAGSLADPEVDGADPGHRRWSDGESPPGTCTAVVTWRCGRWHEQPAAAVLDDRRSPTTTITCAAAGRGAHASAPGSPSPCRASSLVRRVLLTFGHHDDPRADQPPAKGGRTSTRALSARALSGEAASSASCHDVGGRRQDPGQIGPVALGELIDQGLDGRQFPPAGELSSSTPAAARAGEEAHRDHHRRPSGVPKDRHVIRRSHSSAGWAAGTTDRRSRDRPPSPTYCPPDRRELLVACSLPQGAEQIRLAAGEQAVAQLAVGGLEQSAVAVAGGTGG